MRATLAFIMLVEHGQVHEMARPLRAKYLSAGISNGVQEMSDAEINDLIAPLILTYAVSNPDTSYGTSVRTTSSTYGVNRGTALIVGTQPVGTHPATASTIGSYTIFQTERAQSLTTLNVVRPLYYSISNNQTQILEMSDSIILSDFIPSVVQTMITGGQGAYYLGLTASGAPATGTWVSYGTLDDVYYVNNTLTTEQYTLWQRSNRRRRCKPLRKPKSSEKKRSSKRHLRSTRVRPGTRTRSPRSSRGRGSATLP